MLRGNRNIPLLFCRLIFVPYICIVKETEILKTLTIMTYKRQLEMEMSEMRMVIKHFEKGNEVVMSRWIEKYGYTFKTIVNEFNVMVETYNKKYGKRFGCCKKYSK